MKSFKIRLISAAFAAVSCQFALGAVAGDILEGGIPDWPSVLGDMGHSGFYPGSIGAPITPLWEAALDTASVSSPVVVDGVVFAADLGGTCHAFGPDGNRLWKCRLGGAIEASPVVSNGRVFIGTVSGQMAALDARTGQVIWSVTAGSGSITSAVAEGGFVLFGMGVPDNKIVSLDALKGKKRWEREFSHPVTAAPSVIGDALFVGTGLGDAIKLSVSDGRILWTRHYPRGTFQKSPIAVDAAGAALCPGSYDRGLYHLSSGEGRLTGSFKTPLPTRGDPALFRQLLRMRPERQAEVLRKMADRKSAVSKVLAKDGFVPFGVQFSSAPALSRHSAAVVQSEDGYPGVRVTLRVVDRQKNREHWAINRVVKSEIVDYCVAPILCNNAVIASLGDNELFLADAANGNLIWSHTLDSRILASPAIYDNRIYAVSSAGILHALQGTGSSFVPREFDLGRNTPNPFNPVTEIAYSLPVNTHLTLSVFNVKGERVVDLVKGQRKAGHYSVRWNGKNSLGLAAASGVYFYRLSCDGFVKNRRMIFVK